MWKVIQTARVGQFILVECDGGWNVDFFDSLSRTDIIRRLNEFMRGWEMVDFQFERGYAGVGAVLRVYGVVRGAPLQTVDASQQVVDAINSFWTVGGATATAYVSDVLAVKSTPTDVWGDRLDMALIAVLVLGAAWLIFNVRKGFE